MADTSVLIKVGFQGAQALAGLGSVNTGITKIGTHVTKLKAQHKELGESIQKYMGTLGAASLRSLSDEYDALGRSIERATKLQNQLVLGRYRAQELRNERAGLRSDAMDAVGIGALAFTPVKLAIDFESAMAEVKKVVDFDTPDGFEKLSGEILRMSRYLPLSVEQLAQIAASGGQLGVAAKDIPGFVEQIAKMATAFDMSAEAAGDSMAKLANVYNIPIAQLSNLGDAINQLSNESPAKAADIVTTLGRVGGVAKQFGLSAQQAASLSNAFIALGKAPEVAGTSINAMLLKLQTADKQSAKFQSALGQIGISAKGMKAAIKNDAEGALVGFLQALGAVSPDKQLGLLVDLFGLEYADDIAVLAGSIKTYTDSIATVNGQKVAGSMDKEFQARAKTTAANLQTLKNGLNEMSINIGAAVLPALNDLVGAVKPVIGAIAGWAKENPALAGGIVKLVVGFAALKLGSIAVRYGFNLALTAANSLRMGFTLLQAGGLFGATRWATAAAGVRSVGTAIMWAGRAMLMNPIGLALTAAALVIWKFWGPISGFFKGLWSGLSEGLGPVGASITRVFGPLATEVGRLFSVIGSLLSPMEDVGGKAQSMGRRIGAAVAWGINAFVKLHLFVWSLPGKFYQLGVDLVAGLIGGILNKLGQAKAAIVGMATSIKGWFADALGIKSPSRVFMGFGDNIAQGAQIGIMRGTGKVAQASNRLAQAARGAVAGAALAGAAGAGAAGGGGMVVHYSPNITVQGGATEAVVPAMQQALKLSEREFEQMLNRVLDQRARRNY